MPSRKQTRVKHVCSKHTIPRSIVDDMVRWPAQGQRAGNRQGQKGRWIVRRSFENACVVRVTNTKYWGVYSGVGLPFISKHRVVVLLNHLFLYYPIIDAESCASLARWIEIRMMHICSWTSWRGAWTPFLEQARTRIWQGIYGGRLYETRPAC